MSLIKLLNKYNILHYLDLALEIDSSGVHLSRQIDYYLVLEALECFGYLEQENNKLD